jgi:hypothetical protein
MEESGERAPPPELRGCPPAALEVHAQQLTRPAALLLLPLPCLSLQAQLVS